MNKISQMPDELLLRILSLLPTKDVVATMLLSKRWQFLWMLVPSLLYDDSYQNPEYASFSKFVDRSLFMHEAPVTETLRFKLGRICGSGDIQVWIKATHKCCVRELIIEFVTTHKVTLPRSWYTHCRMLVALELRNAVLVEDGTVTCVVSFPFLKKLSLVYMKHPGDEFVNRLISNCPVLEDLVLKQNSNDNMTVLNVIVPSLKTLVLYETTEIFVDEAHGFVIDAPSLELLNVYDDTCRSFIIRSNMPRVVEATVTISCDHPDQILGCITSVKRLHLCVKDAYPGNSIFSCLLSLKICTCEAKWLNVLMRMLRDSPNLRALKFIKCGGPETDEPYQCWTEPSLVPECLLSSLETVEWSEYKGTEEEKEVVAFILRNGTCLKKVTINPQSTSHRKKLKMIKELSFSPRGSPTCRLSFD